jgi:hypothetical protein
MKSGLSEYLEEDRWWCAGCSLFFQAITRSLYGY